ncbi:MAG TPA: multiheme c-type cytochrome [Gemmatimonadales bacterium]|nr:multiheme c-type cytochrome [Gemmatimonadales bacterium]
MRTFLKTAHFATSARATARSLKGPFTAGHNVLRTGSPGIWFTMARHGDAFYQTGVDSAKARSVTERFDLVVGSGRRGQSYLYWKHGLLFELPVSYLTGPNQWINSPGYRDGEIDFGRAIVPRCLECHSTAFPLTRDRGAVKYAGVAQLGVSCVKCHGDGRRHIQYHASHPGEANGRYILNPARFARDRTVDTCALCHSGGRELRQPPFSYRPGAKLDDYLFPASDPADLVPDVHGNQVGLLQRSKCFRSSPTMSCATCHDVHQPQRRVARFATKCLGCHHGLRHPRAAEIGARLIPECIDCHMPNERSRAIEINTPTQQFSLSFRNHAIGLYPEVTARILQWHQKP